MVDNVNSPMHYLQGKRETIEVIQDYMTKDEFVGYLKGNIIKYVGRFKFKGKPMSTIIAGKIKMQDGKILGDPDGTPLQFS